MGKVIFTADDYGVCDAIDLGIIKAINAGKINSVACLSNHPDLQNRIKFLELKTSGKPVDVGCHFTLTSGKPLTGKELKWMCNSKGEFLSFMSHQRKKPAGSFERIKIRAELELQLQTLRNTGVEVKHLSAHHNILFWFEPYWNVLIEIAKDHNLPIRSPLVRPVQSNGTYLTIVGIKSLVKLKGPSRRELQEFNSQIFNAFHSIPTNVKSASPDFTDSRAYGPAARKVSESTIGKVVDTKVKKIEKELKNISHYGDTVEFMFHLFDDDFEKIKQAKVELKSKQMGYSGIKTAYFDRRIAEYRALMQLNIPNNLLLSNWKTV